MFYYQWAWLVIYQLASHGLKRRVVMQVFMEISHVVRVQDSSVWWVSYTFYWQNIQKIIFLHRKNVHFPLLQLEAKPSDAATAQKAARRCSYNICNWQGDGKFQEMSISLSFYRYYTWNHLEASCPMVFWGLKGAFPSKTMVILGSTNTSSTPKPFQVEGHQNET